RPQGRCFTRIIPLISSRRRGERCRRAAASVFLLPGPLGRLRRACARARCGLPGGRRYALPRTQRRTMLTRESRGTHGIRGRKSGVSPLESGGEIRPESGGGFLFPRQAGDGVGFVDRLDALPLVRWSGAADRMVCEPVAARPSVLAVARLAMLGVNEAE